MTAVTAGERGPAASSRSRAAHVIGASALGTLFEWYDFYLYGALAGTFAAHFFSGVNETTAFIFALATFSVGFIVRPLGALVFGRLGDRIGRKFTFLVTLAIMGLSTFLVGVLPDYAAIGIAAPLLLVTLRVLQGLAIGGEFSGAIVYVAEHAPAGRRGLHTSCIPAMAMGGLLLSLARDCGDAGGDDAGGVFELGLARPLPRVGGPARHLVVDTAAPAREPGFPADAGGAKALARTDCGDLPETGEPAARVRGALRRRDRAGHHFLRGYVLRVLLPRAGRAR